MKFGYRATIGRKVNVEPITPYVPVLATKESNALIFSSFVGSITDLNNARGWVPGTNIML